MKKIIFLDFDGVQNTGHYYVSEELITPSQMQKLVRG